MHMTSGIEYLCAMLATLLFFIGCITIFFIDGWYWFFAASYGLFILSAVFAHRGVS